VKEEIRFNKNGAYYSTASKNTVKSIICRQLYKSSIYSDEAFSDDKRPNALKKYAKSQTNFTNCKIKQTPIKKNSSLSKITQSARLRGTLDRNRS
jgi:hypothetical protein